MRDGGAGVINSLSPHGFINEGLRESRASMDEAGLGKKLQQARKAAGLTQQDLCHKAKLSYSTLAKIERGAIKAPSIFTIQSVAEALGLTLGDLIGEEPPAPEKSKKTSRSGVKFVYFDINGCLVHFFHTAFSRIAEDTGSSADVVETTFWHYNDAVCRGEMTMDEFNRLLAERFKSMMDFSRYYLEAIEPIPETQELLRWVAENYRVGLLSNIMPGLIDAMFERGILPDVTYDAIIDSSKVGALKPEPKIFEIARDWADCKTDEILFIDDSRPNLMAAEHMGWRVMWFDSGRPTESVSRVRDALQPA